MKSKFRMVIQLKRAIPETEIDSASIHLWIDDKGSIGFKLDVGKPL
ncbi:hypothetical protein P5G62_010490 [Neobacillus sp. 179-C4.2 HS]|uniref:Uncharacterized protein n=1 Tax=Neobacillus driksii TaxID=3035913 RepID=A0ABV4YRP0_9BACI|nr:hypothetical protein [Neobacillus sp. 179.-C4.2 HS]